MVSAVASETPAPSYVWPSTWRLSLERVADYDRAVPEVREQFDAARAEWGETGEIELDSGLDYGDGEVVRVLVRKRGNRYDIDDGGRAVEKAGGSGRRDWYEVAKQVAEQDALNISRRGVVFVRSFEGPDIAALAERIASTSLGVYGALLSLDD